MEQAARFIYCYSSRVKTTHLLINHVTIVQCTFKSDFVGHFNSQN